MSMVVCVPSAGTRNRVDWRLLVKQRIDKFAKLTNFDIFWAVGFLGGFCQVTIQVSFTAEYYTIVYLLSKILNSHCNRIKN